MPNERREHESAGSDSHIRVALRVRPLLRRELENASASASIVSVSDNTVTIENIHVRTNITGQVFGFNDNQQPDVAALSTANINYGDTRERQRTFAYDFVYPGHSASSPHYVHQAQIFQDLGTEVLAAAFAGYNVCVLAYGQTSAGKTYTMMGDLEDPSRAGLIPRISEQLFERMLQLQMQAKGMSYTVDVSYLEIYNERARDLLPEESSNAPPSQQNALRVREDAKTGATYVQGLSMHRCSQYEQVIALIQRGNTARTTAATKLNDMSSRSHAIFTINFSQVRVDAERPQRMQSKIHLVDLAGCESAANLEFTNVRLKECGNINRSLVTLGNVISALAGRAQAPSQRQVATALNGDSRSHWSVATSLQDDASSPESKPAQTPTNGDSLSPPAKSASYVPYRDSLLTWLLRDSLGGNAKSIMIASISPSRTCFHETLSTLRFAQRVKKVVNRPKINEDSTARLIRELREEIATLRKLLAQREREKSDSTQQLNFNEALSMELERRTRDMFDQWSRTLGDTLIDVRRSCDDVNSASTQNVLLQPRGPHLVFLGDHLSTQTHIYPLAEQTTIIGAAQHCHVQLTGLGLLETHCRITRNDLDSHSSLSERRGSSPTNDVNATPSFVLFPEAGANCIVNHKKVSENGTVLPQGAVLLLSGALFRFNNPAEAELIRHQSAASRRPLAGINELAAESDASFLGAAFRSTWQIRLADADDDENADQFTPLRAKEYRGETLGCLERSVSLPGDALAATSNALLFAPLEQLPDVLVTSPAAYRVSNKCDSECQTADDEEKLQPAQTLRKRITAKLRLAAAKSDSSPVTATFTSTSSSKSYDITLRRARSFQNIDIDGNQSASTSVASQANTEAANETPCTDDKSCDATEEKFEQCSVQIQTEYICCPLL